MAPPIDLDELNKIAAHLRFLSDTDHEVDERQHDFARRLLYWQIIGLGGSPEESSAILERCLQIWREQVLREGIEGPMAMAGRA